MRVGVQISGIAEADKLLSDIAKKAGIWARTRVGARVGVPYWHWINFGFYLTGRPGRTTAYHYAEKARAEIVPTIGPLVAQSIMAGGNPSETTDRLAQRLAEIMRGHQPAVSGRLRASTVPFRGGGLRGL